MSTTLDKKNPYINISRQLGWGVYYFGHKHITPVRLGCPPLWTKNPVHKHITPVRLGCPPLWTKRPVHKHITLVRLGGPLSTKKNVQGKNTHTEEDNYDNGAEQPLTIEVRLQRGPKITCYKKPLGQKKAGNLGRDHGSCSSDW